MGLSSWGKQEQAPAIPEPVPLLYYPLFMAVRDEITHNDQRLLTDRNVLRTIHDFDRLENWIL